MATETIHPRSAPPSELDHTGPAPWIRPQPVSVPDFPGGYRVSFNRFLRQLWIWMGLLLLCLASFAIVQSFLLRTIVVQGKSMSPTLENGDRYLLNRLTYLAREPGRGEVVVVQDPGHPDFAVKRIIGLPGDSVQLKHGAVWLNGKQLLEPYLPPGTVTLSPDFRDKTIILGHDEYYLLGDNRAVSEDSRYYGPLERKHLIGVLGQQ